jgi:glycosyltransferase involved in cell wall biosynthesis
MALEITLNLFLIVSVVHITFYLLSLIKLGRFRPENDIQDDDEKPASIIVCSHNEKENLKNLIPKLLSQTYTNFEVIVVDDRSNDGSYEYLLNEKQTNSALKLVRIDWTPEHVNPKKYALTLGIKSAQNDIMVMTDADCEPVSSNWLKQMANKFDDKTDFVLGFSYYKRYPGFLNLFIRYETLQTALLYITMALSGNPYMGVGRNIGYKRSFFLSRKGFNKFLNVTGGDDDLFVSKHSSARNTVAVLQPESVILSEPKNSFRDYFIQKIRHISVSKMYRFRHKLLIGVFSFSKILFWILGLSLMVLSHKILWIAGLFSIQLLLLLWVYNRFTKILKVKYELYSLWLMEFVYISYLVIFSLSAFTAKKIKWS